MRSDVVSVQENRPLKTRKPMNYQKKRKNSRTQQLFGGVAAEAAGGICTYTEPSEQTISEHSARGPMMPNEVQAHTWHQHQHIHDGPSNRATGGTPSDNNSQSLL